MRKIFKRKIVEYIVYTVMLASIIAAALAVFWMLEDPHILTVKNAKTSEPKANGTIFSGIPIRPAKIKPGGIIIMHFDYCKSKDIDGVVTARLVGQKFITRLAWPNDRSKADCVNADFPIPIPDSSNDDTYYIEFEVKYQINPLKDRDVILRSDTFTVSEQ